MQRKDVTKKKDAKDGSKLKIGVVVSTYYDDITGRMLAGALQTLKEWNVAEKNVSVVRVSGSFEITYGCLSLLKRKKYDAIITIGCIIKGETKHDEYIAHAVAQGIVQMMVAYKTPISFGVLTTNDLPQAITRSTGKDNKGTEAALAALEAALL
jgi:6,7-dimethyl-8-ribityllumazine synthase